ncbi:TetR/AcrR family transcriptional regulator [Hymenobacter jejuensis]|uniref:TetR/AcrR family transcriptional regulator n=1 Tax=Hymenobacter jejuensis TaxID=2502781 RepID=A0A5B8A6H3_9BACT|nr:TetR/AcrR family transcriptional regulator [Hymenobacter jejuensis]QDA62393.1 TetR/AcrR family transcriptional regulator [Hymenobacter jejuensis]
MGNSIFAMGLAYRRAFVDIKEMAKRGSELRTHMLHAAKAVFLETGFERASMDRIAAHAGTTKRTLYAHFVRKEDLFLAVFDLVLDLQLDHLKGPADYAHDPGQALVLFCARFLETVLSSKPIRLFRLAITEAERFPQGAVRLHEAMFENVQARVAHFLHERLGVADAESQTLAQGLLAQLLYPRFTRALFGADEPAATWSEELGASPAVDLNAIRQVVGSLVPLTA